jgi:gliding motility-associated-like protein
VYPLVLTTPAGCTDTLLLNVLAAPQVSFAYTPSRPVLPDSGVITFRNTTPAPAGVSFLWRFYTAEGLPQDSITDSQPTRTYTQPGTYRADLLAIADNGCQALAVDSFEVRSIVRLQFPTAFSPNEDSFNEQWRAFTTSVGQMEIRIYNRWGTQIYTAAGAPETLRWDGRTQKGEPVPEGVYILQADYTLLDGKTGTHTGTITVLR